MNQPYVHSELKNGVATIEFYHPAHNSLPGNVLAELTEAINNVGSNDEVKVVILKAGGDRTFCAGASFDELIAISDETTGKDFFMGFANVINACRKCPKLIIGRVHGKAVGGGVGLASAVDYCVATKYAAIRLSELAVGIGPFVVGPAIERKIGKSAFSEMAMNAWKWQNAYWGKEKGLFTEVYENTVEMDDAIEEFAGKLIKSNPSALYLLKQVFWEGTADWDTLLEKRAEMSGRLVLSSYAKKAIEAFRTK